MGIKRTILAGIVFALSIAALVADRQATERREAERLASARLLPMEQGEAATIVVRHLNSEMELKKSGEGWRVARPVEDAADPEAVAALLESLDGQSRFGSQAASEKELASFGLAKPPLGVTVADASGGKKLDLLVGIDTPVPGQVYARLEGANRCFTIAAELRDQLSRPLLEFRDRRLVTIDAKAATRLTLAHEGLAIDAAKIGGLWNLERPLAAPAEAEAIDEILRTLQATRAEDLITTDTSDLARFGLASPAATAILAGAGDGTTSTLMVGFRRLAAKPSYYAARKGDSRIMVVGQEVLDRIRPSVSDLRSKQIFAIDKEDVGSLAVKWNGIWTTLLRDGDGVWRFQDAANGEKPDQAFANETLQKLLRLRVAEYLKVQLLPEDSGLDSPTVQARITSRDGKKSEGIETGRPMANRQLVYARKEGDAEVFTVGLDRPADFFIERLAFLDRTMFEFDPARVASAVIGSKGNSFELKRDASGWMMGVAGSDKSFQLKATDVERFFVAGRGLRWEEKLSAQAFGALATEALGGTVEFRDASGARLLSLDIQGQDKRRVFTKSPDGAIYAVDKTIYAPFVSALNNLVKAK